jgi:gamma-glutamyl:cysteine ligase YbdK (ATP-grasp superfamily)
MTSLAIASAAASVVTQVQSAKRQEAAIRDQLAQTQGEIQDKATGAVNERLREARREQARVKVAAGEAGLQLGGSIDLLLQDITMQSGLSAERIKQNRDNEMTNATAEANSMLSRVEKPTILGAGLQIATAGMNGYSAGTSMKINRRNADIQALNGG